MILVYLLYRGNRVPLYINPFSKVRRIKYIIREKLSIDVNSMKLLFGGKVLQNSQVLDTVGIKKECCIIVMGKKLLHNSSVQNSRKRYYYIYICTDNKKVFVTLSAKINGAELLHSNSNGVLFRTDKVSKHEIKIVAQYKISHFYGKIIREIEKRLKVTVDKLGKQSVNCELYEQTVPIDIYYFPIITDIQRDYIEEKEKLDEQSIRYISGDKVVMNIVEEIDYKSYGYYFDEFNIKELERIYSKKYTIKTEKEQFIKIDKNIDINRLQHVVDYGYCTKNHYIVKPIVPLVFFVNSVLALEENINFKSFGKVTICEEVGEYNKICCSRCNVKLDKWKYYNGPYCKNCYEIEIENDFKHNRLTNKMVKFFLKGTKKKSPMKYKEIGEVTKCPSCTNEYIVMSEYREEYNDNYVPNVTILGKKMEVSYAKEYQLNRIKCLNCENDYCKKCSKIGYHTGYTCKEWILYEKSGKCVYCKDVVEKGSNICSSEKCKHYKQCTVEDEVECGHYNYGFDKYPLCLKCENIEDEQCTICTDKLYRKPCIKLDCNHVFHLKCIENTVKKGDSTNYITLKYFHCNICYFRISHEYFDKHIDKISKINCAMEKKTEKYIEYEQIKENVDRVRDKVRFYNCEECGKLYLSGPADCQEEAEEIERSYLCRKCGTIGESTCKKHKQKYIFYKCFYCCNVAVWDCDFACFCEPCHSAYCDNRNYKPIPCPGKKECILGIEHPKNDKKTKFALGCSMCLPTNFKSKLRWIYSNNRF